MKPAYRLLFVVAVTGLLPGFPLSAQEDVPDAKAPPSQKSEEATETKTEQTGSKLSHAEDGSFDVSKVAEKTHSVIPLVFPITEPAVGYGALGGLIFLEKPENTEEGETMRPNLTAVGGMATENGTWGAFAGDVRHFKKNTLQSMVAGGYASVNLTYSPPASESPPSEDPQTFEYNIKAPFLYLRGTYRFKKSSWSVSLGYVVAGVVVAIPGDNLPPELQFPDSTEIQAAIAPAITYDSRDNVFTPTKGLYFTAASSIFNSAWGSSADYNLPYVKGMYYHPVSDKVFLGLKARLATSHGDTPFYARPFIMLRGIPAMRYQGDSVGDGEAEVRWQCYKRFSLVGFGGYGTARTDFENRSSSETVTTYGVGFRYEIAREFGIHMGADIARGPEDTVFYIQFGSAWLSP